MTFEPEGVMVSCGRNERLNTVPLPELPPEYAVPYRVLPDKINPACGLTPSLLTKLLDAVKLCRFVKPVPSVLTANTVPPPEPAGPQIPQIPMPPPRIAL